MDRRLRARRRSTAAHTSSPAAAASATRSTSTTSSTRSDLALEREEAAGETFLVADDDAVTWRMLYEPVCRALGSSWEAVADLAPRAPRPTPGERLLALRDDPAARVVLDRVPRTVRNPIRRFAGRLLAEEPSQEAPRRPALETSILQTCGYRFPTAKARRLLGFEPPVAFDEACRQDRRLARLRGRSGCRRDTGGRPVMASPLVSAVTIVRDGERFLAEAIESVAPSDVPEPGARRGRRRLDRPQRRDRRARRRARHAGTRPARSARRLRQPRHERGADAGRADRARRADRLPRRRRRVASREDRRAGRRPRRPPGRGDGLRPHADVAQLGPERGAQRPLLRPRRRARSPLPAAQAAAAAAREPRPVPDDVQRPRAPLGVRGGGRVRDAVLRPVRGPDLLREAVPALGDLRLEPVLGALPPPRGERAARALLLRALPPRAARVPRVAGGALADLPVDEAVAAVLASELRRAQHPYRAALAARLRPARRRPAGARAPPRRPCR